MELARERQIKPHRSHIKSERTPQVHQLPTWDELASSYHALDENFATRAQALRSTPPRLAFEITRLILKTFLREPTFSKFLAMPWRDVIDLMADQVARNAALIKARPDAKLLAPVSERIHEKLVRSHNQLPCTKLTTSRRVEKALTLAPLQAPVLLLGDDDLVSIDLGLAGYTDVTVLDIDRRVLQEIEREAVYYDLKISCHHHDLSHLVPTALVRDYSLIFMDPIYTPAGLTLFLDGAMALTTRESPTTVFMSVHLMSLLRDGLGWLQTALDARGLEIRECQQGFNAYPVPPPFKYLIHLVNRFLIGSQMLSLEGRAFPYFFSDALVLETTPTPDGCR